MNSEKLKSPESPASSSADPVTLELNFSVQRSALSVGRSGADSPRSVATSVDATQPWLGLASFTEETRTYFHGRDEEVAELSRRVQRKLLTILFGQSGLGKTSILRAGVVPRLRAEGYCPVYVRIDYGADSPPPPEQIKQAVIRATGEAGRWSRPGVSAAGESLWEFLHHRDDVLRDASGRALVPLLIFDQFEEIFTLAQTDDFGRRRAAQFKEDLADLVENRAPKALELKLERDDTAAEQFDFARADYRILIALREDYLAHLESLKGEMPSVTQNRMRLARMTGTQALSAVTGPGGALVTDEVARSIVRFVAGGAELERAEVEPSLLSLVCRELNNTRLAQGRPEISADLLAGSRDTILNEFYERALADQPAGVRAFIEDELLTDSGYRESIAEERARKGFAAAGAAPEALAMLVDRRLLRVEERLDVRRVELTHDVLCGVVKTSRDLRLEREGKAMIERQLAETQAKEEAGQRQLRRARLLAAAGFGLFVLATASASFGYVNLRRARAAENRVGHERDRAQLSRGEAEKLVTFLLDDLYTQLEPTGRIEIVSGLARRALAYFNALPPELRDVRSDRYRAIALSRLGLALSQQGKTLEAEDPLREAEQLFASVRSRGDNAAETTVAMAAVVRQQSRNAYLQNRPKPSIELGKAAVALIAPVATGPEAPGRARLEHGRALLNLGFVLLRDRQNDLALATLEQARTIFAALMQDAEQQNRADILYAETVCWLCETGRFLGRGPEFKGVLDEGLRIAQQAVDREAGNLGALRSRALLRSRQGAMALDQYDYAAAETISRQVAADWTEFLRFDNDNDTARNNRRVAVMQLAESLWRQGKFDEVIATTKSSVREAIAGGGSPSAVRNVAFQIERVDNLEAELGRVRDIDAATADGRRMRELASSQVDSESYFRALTPVWNDQQRSDIQVRMGQSAAALETARSVETRLRSLAPTAGIEALAQRMLVQSNLAVQMRANLALGQWNDAARAARLLVAGRPSLDDTSPGALDTLATDQATAAIALARAGERSDAQPLLDAAAKYNAERRARGARDHATRLQTALIAFARALLTDDGTDKRAALNSALGEIAAMPAQPQQLRFVRELRDDLQKELAALGGSQGAER